MINNFWWKSIKYYIAAWKSFNQKDIDNSLYFFKKLLILKTNFPKKDWMDLIKYWMHLNLIKNIH